MKPATSISQIAGLMAEPKRSAMLWALIDGVARPADELAALTGVTASSACAHLSLLSAAGLLRLEARGRKRYFRLATPAVSAAVEALASVQLNTRGAPRKPVEVAQIPLSMRRARRCGGHLGGQLAAELYQRLVTAGWLDHDRQQVTVTAVGREQLNGLGVYIDALAPGPRGAHCLCHCQEWSDYGPHLGGSLGHAFLQLFLQSGWIREQETTRALQISATGVQSINRIAAHQPRQVG